jgi:hypothetical protein
VRQPAEQRAPAAEAIAERAGQQQQRREDQGVGVDHPLQLADVRVQVAHERRQRDVDDGVVDDDDQQAQAQDTEGQPPPAGTLDVDHVVTVAWLEAVCEIGRRRSPTKMTTAKAISHTLQST